MCWLFFFYLFQVSEREQLLKQLKEDVEKEENNYKPKDNLQLCQVSHKCFFSVKYTTLFINVRPLQTFISA